MHYLIDYDTRTVEFQHGNRKELEQHVKVNDLEMAVGIISGSKDLAEQLTYAEMSEFYETIELETLPLSEADDMADALWESITGEEFTKYTKAKGKQAVKSNPAFPAGDKSTGSPKTAPKSKPKATTPAKPRTSLKTDGKLVVLGDNPPTRGRHQSLYNMVVENLDEIPYNELVDGFIAEYDCTEAKAREYITVAFRKNHLCLK